jgi:two-component system CheB/CheR fusion protein
MLLVTAAMLVTYILPSVFGGASYLIFFPAIVAAAAFGGLGPGLLATGVSGLCLDLLFTPPVGQISSFRDPAEAAREAVFLVGGTAASLVAGLRYSARVRERRLVSDRERAEQSLVDQDSFLSRVLESLTHPFYVIDVRDYTIKMANSAARLGKLGPHTTCYQLTHRSDVPCQLAGETCPIEQIRSSGKPFTVEHVHYDSEGNARICEVHAYPVFDRSGNVSQIIEYSLDITARKRAEEALRESESNYRVLAEFSESAINSLPGVFYLFKKAGSLLRWNRNLEEVTGYSPRDISAMSPLDFFNPDEKGIVAEAIGRVFTAGEASVEAQLVRKDGSSVPYHFVGSRMVIDDVPYLIGAGIDMTARQKIEAELCSAKRIAEQATAAAEKASKAKDHFLAVLSHELRTPLTPVLAAVSLLQQEVSFDEGTTRILEMVRRNVELEARLIDDLLDLTRITRGKIELDKRPIELRTVLQRAVEVCRPDIEARRLHFGVDLGPAATCLVEADTARLQQVFWNLLKNAIKFTPQGGCVGIRCRPGEHGRVSVEVIDSGEGIDPQDLSRIFGAFEQAGRSASRLFGGLGLGLAISRTLVELHGGTIEAHSEGKGKGASFKVQLPTLSVSAAWGPAAQKGRLARARREETRSLCVLLVEDHGDTADMMQRMLESEGHQVQTAGDVATALDMASGQSFDLLISDLGLPDGSGLDLMRELRARGDNLPGIAVSGYGQEQDILQARDVGFAAHVVKPLDMDRLRTVLDDVASHTSRAG